MEAEEWHTQRQAWARNWGGHGGNWRTVRVFISSTFSDMQGERDSLTRAVFPALNAHPVVKSRRVRIVPVDLRWGLTAEDTSSAGLGAIEHCLLEISSSKPFFIALVSERYGWVPPKSEVRVSDRHAWVTELEQGHSITHIEVQHGVLRSLRPTYAYAYFRDPSFVDEIPAEDVTERAIFSFDHPGNTAIASLRDDMRTALRTHPYVASRDYQCHYGGNDSEGKPVVVGLSGFEKMVYDDILAALTREFPSAPPPPTGLEQERRFHMSVIDQAVTGMVGRTVQLQQLNQHVQACPGLPLVLYGPPGIGKTTLLCAFAKRLLDVRADEVVCLTHIVSASPASADIRETLLRLCAEMSERFRLDESWDQDAAEEDYQVLRSTFEDVLRRAGDAAARSSQRLVILLDAVDQLLPFLAAHSMDWLPTMLPANVCVILSASSGCEPVRSLSRRDPPPLAMEVPGLSVQEREQLVVRALAEYRKRLTPVQLKLLLDKQDADRALYLRTACEELRLQAQFGRDGSGVDSAVGVLPGELRDLLHVTLDRVERDMSTWAATTAAAGLLGGAPPPSATATATASASTPSASTAELHTPSHAHLMSHSSPKISKPISGFSLASPKGTAGSGVGSKGYFKDSGDGAANQAVPGAGGASGVGAAGAQVDPATDIGYALVRDALSLLVCSRDGLHESELLELLAPPGSGKAQLPLAVWARLHRSLELYLQGAAEENGLVKLSHSAMVAAVSDRYLFNNRVREAAVHARLATYYSKKVDPAGDGTYSGDATGAGKRYFDGIAFHLIRAGRFSELRRLLGSLAFIQKRAQQGTAAMEQLVRDYHGAQGFLQATPAQQLRAIVPKSEQATFSRGAALSWLQEMSIFASAAHTALTYAPHLTFQLAWNQPGTSEPHQAAARLLQEANKTIVKQASAAEVIARKSACTRLWTALADRYCTLLRAGGHAHQPPSPVADSETDSSVADGEGTPNNGLNNSSNKIIAGGARAGSAMEANMLVAEEAAANPHVIVDPTEWLRRCGAEAGVPGEDSLQDITTQLGELWRGKQMPYQAGEFITAFVIALKEEARRGVFGSGLPSSPTGRKGFAFGLQSPSVQTSASLDATSLAAPAAVIKQPNVLRLTPEDAQALGINTAVIMAACEDLVHMQLQHSADGRSSKAADASTADSKVSTTISNPTRPGQLLLQDEGAELPSTAIVPYLKAPVPSAYLELLNKPNRNRLVADFAGLPSPVTCMAVSNDYTLMALGFQSGSIRLLHASTGQQVRELSGHEGPVTCVAWSPDDIRLASGGQDQTVLYWDALTGGQLEAVQDHTGSVTSLLFIDNSGNDASDANGRAGSKNRGGASILVHSPSNHGDNKHSPKDGTSSNAALPGRRRGLRTLVSTSMEGDIRVYKEQKDALSTKMLMSASAVGSGMKNNASDASMAGQVLASMWVRDFLASPIVSTCWEPMSAHLVAGHGDGGVTVYDARAPSLGLIELCHWKAHEFSAVTCCALRADGLLASGGSDGHVRLWRRSAIGLNVTFKDAGFLSAGNKAPAHTATVTSIKFAPGSGTSASLLFSSSGMSSSGSNSGAGCSLVLTSSLDKRVVVWDTDAGTSDTSVGDGSGNAADRVDSAQVLVLSGHADAVYAATFLRQEDGGHGGPGAGGTSGNAIGAGSSSSHSSSTQHGRGQRGDALPLVASTGSDRTCKIWDIHMTGAELNPQAAPVQRPNMDAMRLVLAGGAQSAAGIDGADGNAGGGGAARKARRPGDVARGAGRNAVLNEQSKERPAPAGAHGDRVTCALVTSDVKYGITGSADKQVKVWSVDNGSEVCVLMGHLGPVTAMALNPAPDDAFIVGNGSGQPTVNPSPKARQQLASELLFTCDATGVIHAWEAGTFNHVKALPAQQLAPDCADNNASVPPITAIATFYAMATPPKPSLLAQADTSSSFTGLEIATQRSTTSLSTYQSLSSTTTAVSSVPRKRAQQEEAAAQQRALLAGPHLILAIGYGDGSVRCYDYTAGCPWERQVPPSLFGGAIRRITIAKPTNNNSTRSSEGGEDNVEGVLRRRLRYVLPASATTAAANKNRSAQALVAVRSPFTSPTGAKDAFPIKDPSHAASNINITIVASDGSIAVLDGRTLAKVYTANAPADLGMLSAAAMDPSGQSMAVATSMPVPTAHRLMVMQQGQKSVPVQVQIPDAGQGPKMKAVVSAAKAVVASLQQAAITTNITSIDGGPQIPVRFETIAQLDRARVKERLSQPSMNLGETASAKEEAMKQREEQRRQRELALQSQIRKFAEAKANRAKRAVERARRRELERKLYGKERVAAGLPEVDESDQQDDDSGDDYDSEAEAAAKQELQQVKTARAREEVEEAAAAAARVPVLSQDKMVSCLSYSPDGSLLAAGCTERLLTVLRTSNLCGEKWQNPEFQKAAAIAAARASGASSGRTTGRSGSYSSRAGAAADSGNGNGSPRSALQMLNGGLGSGFDPAADPFAQFITDGDVRAVALSAAKGDGSSPVVVAGDTTGRVYVLRVVMTATAATHNMHTQKLAAESKEAEEAAAAAAALAELEARDNGGVTPGGHRAPKAEIRLEKITWPLAPGSDVTDQPATALAIHVPRPLSGANDDDAVLAADILHRLGVDAKDAAIEGTKQVEQDAIVKYLATGPGSAAGTAPAAGGTGKAANATTSSKGKSTLHASASAASTTSITALPKADASLALAASLCATHWNSPKAMVCVFGGAAQLHAALLVPALKSVIHKGVVWAAAAEGAMIIDGGTDSGVMRIVADAVAAAPKKAVRIVGVAPGGLIQRPGEPPSADPNVAPLQKEASGYVLVPSKEWGGETDTMWALISQLQKTLPAVCVLANGGIISKKEVVSAVRYKVPIVVMEGSGRLADTIVRSLAVRKAMTEEQWMTEGEAAVPDAVVREIVTDGRLHCFQLTAKPEKMRALLHDILVQERDKIILGQTASFALLKAAPVASSTTHVAGGKGFLGVLTQPPAVSITTAFSQALMAKA